MSRTAASLSPDIQRRLDTKLLNTNNNNSATLNNLSINNNKTVDQYDCTSIASVSESWSAGNGEDLDNMPLVLTGTDIGGIENKDWSAYIRKSNAYNSSEDDNEQGGGDDDDDEDSDLNTKTNDSNSDPNTQDGFSSSNKKSSTLKPNTKLTSKHFFDEMDSNKATAAGGAISSGLNKKKKKKIDKTGNNEGIIRLNSKNNNKNNGGVIDDDDIENSLNDNDSDEIDDDDDDVEEDDDDDDDDYDYGDDDNNNEDNENDLDDDDIWTIKPKLLKYYEKQFKSMQSDLNGLISGLEAKQFFEKSKLPLNELSKIWELSDVNRDGALSFSEFCTAMHLVVLRVRNFELPDQLPAKLQPYAPLIDFESDATAAAAAAATGAVNQTSSSSILNDKIINKQLNNQHLTQLSPISTNSPISFTVNPQIQTDQSIVHPVPLRIQQQQQQQTPFAEMAKLRSPVATSAIAPRPQPPPRHSRSSSLGAIINKVQPPAIPPRENDANNANIPQHTMLPPPPPPPPLPPPPPTIASPATIVPNTAAVVTTISPPPPSTLATQFLNQKTIENIVEQVHNINLDQMRRLQEENQLTENLFEKLKQSKENNYKLRKYYIDLEKELRNLTDTRIALEIKYESLIALASASTVPLPQSTNITTTPQLNNNNTNSNNNNSNVNINNANLATTKYI